MKKPQNIKICLNAMVGNEAATISRMLESVADYVDYYVIQCNGKTDNTKQIIDDFFAQRGVPGFTYEIDWDYPGWNRDHTLQTCLQADHGCDWILRMDADEQLKVEDDFDWNIFTYTNVQSFNIIADPGDSLYYRTWLWNAKLPWYFAHDKRHETIWLPEVGESFERVNLPRGFRHIITNDGETWFAPMKFLKDALELEMDKVTTNKVLEDDYHLWYIGKSYSDSYGDASQFPFGMDHAKEYARRTIFYYNIYLNKLHPGFSETGKPAQPDDMGYYAMYLIAQAQWFIGDRETALKTLQQAGPFNPVRNEHLDLIARYNDELQDWNAMFEATSRMVHSGRPNPFPTSSFLILNRSYFDTSFEPNYLHLKATINANKPADLIKNAKDLLLTRHRIGTLPDYVVDLVQVANRIAGEEVQEKKEPLQGVFGATK